MTLIIPLRIRNSCRAIAWTHYIFQIATKCHVICSYHDLFCFIATTLYLVIFLAQSGKPLNRCGFITYSFATLATFILGVAYISSLVEHQGELSEGSYAWYIAFALHPALLFVYVVTMSGTLMMQLIAENVRIVNQSLTPRLILLDS